MILKEVEIGIMDIILPWSVLIVLDYLATSGPKSPKVIASEMNLAPRTVSFALRRLTKAKLCHKTPNLQDMRQPIYHANIKRVAALEKQIEQARIQARAHFRSM
jgi:DNA-binding MarR family transcriptional regulator